ncbi:clotting factor B [Lepeophtheirus salmonis]|uniref:clotting factor B n=1 Tax=Lepeophtheirus salmonis TaxID=72036 RepID=UPI001AEB4C33|nr:clotting factor B-like isoform X1 [Lepeophtheirus salmonis]XP_040581472.1 clotting factor B-like isoform X1 [Lepeophtheirus salmonis]
MLVITGYLDLREILDRSHVHKVKKIYIHSDYKEWSLLQSIVAENDISILELFSPLKLSVDPEIGVACLPIPNENVSSINFRMGKDFVTILGYGTTNNGARSCCLRYAKDLRSMGWRNCKKRLFRDFHFSSVIKYLTDKTMNSNSVCSIGNEKHKATSCIGDSGGGMYFLEDDRYVLMGVTSYGKVSHAMCDYQSPFVSANIRVYIDWILKIIHGDNFEIQE